MKVKSKLLDLMVDGRLKPKDIFKLARLEVPLALKVIEEIGSLNAAGVASVINVYDPEVIIVGGSVALNNRELIIKPIMVNIRKFVINRPPKIEVTQLGDDIVLYGALAIAIHPPEELLNHMSS